MKLFVNGQPHEVTPSETLATLLGRLGISPKGTAVELNQEIIPRARHASHVLVEGDRVEIVTFVGGG